MKTFFSFLFFSLLSSETTSPIPEVGQTTRSISSLSSNTGSGRVTPVSLVPSTAIIGTLYNNRKVVERSVNGRVVNFIPLRRSKSEEKPVVRRAWGE